MKATCVSFNEEERELLKRHERPGLSMSQLVRDAVNEKYREKEILAEALPEQPQSSNNESNENKSALDQLFQATTAELAQRFFKSGTRKNG